MKSLTASQGSKLVTSFIISYMAGFIGSLFTNAQSLAWYATLLKPSFAPPSWVFAPVWTVLYACIGVALFRVWISRSHESKTVMRIFGVHIALNALWSILFFGLQNPLLGYVGIVLVWITLSALIVDTWKFDRATAILLMPYGVWIIFASMLNFVIWFMN